MARTARSSPPVNGRAVPRKAVSHAKVGPDPDDDHDDDTDASHEDDVPAARPPVDALSEMMAGLQGASTSRITVYRIVKNQPPTYVCETDPTGFSLDDLRDKYNGGEFRLYVMKDGRLWKNMRVVVEPKQVVHGADPAPPTSGLSDLVMVMREGFAAQNAALRDALAARPPSMFTGVDIPAVITAAAAAITALRPPPPPVPPPAPDMTSTAMDMFMRGVELANSMRENSGPADNSIGGMFREALRSPIVQAAVQSAMQPAPPRPPQPAQPALLGPSQAQPPVSHAKPAEPISVPTAQEENQVLAHYLAFLVSKAKSGADATLYADLVLDNVPDQQMTTLLNHGDKLIDFLIATHAPVAEHREWFTTLIQSVNDALSSDEQPGEANAADAETIVVPGNASA